MEPVVLLVLIGLLSIICQLLAHRIKLPAILPLLIAGVVMGPMTGILDSDALFGDLLFPIVSLSVAIILFEGALSLNFTDLGTHGRTVRNLVTLGVAVSWLVVAPAAHWLLDMPWAFAFLFSAIVTVTGPTVVIPMLRAVRPNKHIGQILRWEGIIIDPIGAILAVLVFEFLVSSQNALAHTLMAFGKTVLAGTSLGILCGYLLSATLRKGLIPGYLVNTAVLTVVLGVFEGANLAAHESGLLAVTIMGVWLANAKDVDVEGILEFKETLSVLLISGLFIILAARVDFDQLYAIAGGAIGVIVVMLLVARPIGVFLSSWGSSLTWQQKALIVWMAPRGIIAAAVSALFALKLEQQGYDNANLLVSLVFFVIIFTVVVQSLTSKRLAKMLGVREPAPVGFLIFGGNEFSRMLAKELMAADVAVKLADTNWASISAARMEGIPTYFGNPSSEHAQRTLDLTGIGYVLVLSPYKQLNSLVTQHFQDVLGSERVFGLSLAEQKRFEGHQPNERYLKSLGIFGNATYGKLASLVAKGARLKKTPLTESYRYEDYQQANQGTFTPLFMVDPQGRVKLFRDDVSTPPTPGAQIISLIRPEDEG
ncbi:cation:proton antiporter [Aestuariibacter halophilus]|uniref:Cation:proton antiporter n=2 Tax=Fluctibacter halophilus TaxID=226011 RepID=A0ABS8G6B3_9ALTE|nr:sodium:proton antiporter [Aestuariibacter halophilus]MCC2615390.1 cation:proton antiporter [Aestuariibacter halophilus]